MEALEKSPTMNDQHRHAKNKKNKCKWREIEAIKEQHRLRQELIEMGLEVDLEQGSR